MNEADGPSSTTDSGSRYQKIAPLYDLVELPFEYARYRRLRRMLFAGLSGRILDAGVGTGRNMPFYPTGGTVSGIDNSPRMLARAEARRKRLGIAAELLERDVRKTGIRMGCSIPSSPVFCSASSARKTSCRHCAS